MGVLLQSIGHTVNVEIISLAHDGVPHCGNGINRRYPGSENVPASLAELLNNA
jgi:hypothetical protein